MAYQDFDLSGIAPYARDEEEEASIQSFMEKAGHILRKRFGLSVRGIDDGVGELGLKAACGREVDVSEMVSAVEEETGIRPSGRVCMGDGQSTTPNEVQFTIKPSQLSQRKCRIPWKWVLIILLVLGIYTRYNSSSSSWLAPSSSAAAP